MTTIITTRNDIAVYVDNNHADFAQTMGDAGRVALVDAIQAAASPDDFTGVEDLDPSEGPKDEETPDAVVRFTSTTRPAITVALFDDAGRAAVRWNDGWSWTDLYKSSETALEIMTRYLCGDMRE